MSRPQHLKLCRHCRHIRLPAALGEGAWNEATCHHPKLLARISPVSGEPVACLPPRCTVERADSASACGPAGFLWNPTP